MLPPPKPPTSAPFLSYALPPPLLALHLRRHPQQQLELELPDICHRSSSGRRLQQRRTTPSLHPLSAPLSPTTPLQPPCSSSQFNPLPIPPSLPLQDKLAYYWGAVAAAFADCPHVIGYELMNEPFAGTPPFHPYFRIVDLLSHEFRRKLLFQPRASAARCCRQTNAAAHVRYDANISPPCTAVT
jgi:hypothetical protein